MVQRRTWEAPVSCRFRGLSLGCYSRASSAREHQQDDEAGGNNRDLHQVLHEHAASLSAATHANRSRRLIKCAKDSGHYHLSHGTGCASLALGVERRDDEIRRSGELYVPLVLGWAGSVYPLNRSIGSKTDAVADLLFVRNDVLRFVPVVIPNNFQAEYTGDTHLRVTPIARGIDCESNPIRLNIDWDEKWEFGDNAMAKHLVITETV